MISGLPVARLGSVGRLRGSVPLVLGPNNRYLSHRGSADTRNPGSPCCFFFSPDPPPFPIPSPVPSVSFGIFELLSERQRRAQTATSDKRRSNTALAGASTQFRTVRFNVCRVRWNGCWWHRRDRIDPFRSKRPSCHYGTRSPTFIRRKVLQQPGYLPTRRATPGINVSIAPSVARWDNCQQTTSSCMLLFLWQT